MTARRLLIATFALAGWILAGVLAVLLYVLLNHPLGDEIDVAERHTRDLLALHMRRDQTNQLVTWLTQYHGEAPGHQVMISFARWAADNTLSTEKLLDDPQMKPEFLERLAFAVTDSGQTHAFCTAFQKSSSSVIRVTLANVNRLDPTCEINR